MQVRGIMFDMDNTILQSRIDFTAMKQDVFDFLVDRKLLEPNISLDDHTTSTLLETGKKRGLTPTSHDELMERILGHESKGMDKADLEEGASDLLRSLHNRYTLAIVTNNGQAAAKKALERTGVSNYFNLVAGREQMEALKPSPSGLFYVLKQFPEIEGWIFVGDSWIDGKAANQANVPFIAYQPKKEDLKKHGIETVGEIECLAELTRFLGFSVQ
eukprot:TRINITY_DN8943_c0_g1_i1.p1 TRINITY_DN8943_c0_g1~~TRINITY_DN8943_c0_g1_i1.p1  ORF type:complete len:216 (-),score=34.41 TRINITY_DN8943_c0_g1_i1:28-675(-)